MVALTLSLVLWLLVEGMVCFIVISSSSSIVNISYGCGVLGSSLTRGFPSLEELIRNGSLLERYSTHDGELRSVPGVRWNCSGTNGRISKITFIALPGVGIDRPVLRVVRDQGGGNQDLDISGETQIFGEFGYEMTVNSNVVFNDGDMLLISHPPYDDGSLRLLYQAGDVARSVCIGTPGSQNCQLDRDYPLLAIETGRQN